MVVWALVNYFFFRYLVLGPFGKYPSYMAQLRWAFLQKVLRRHSVYADAHLRKQKHESTHQATCAHLYPTYLCTSKGNYNP